MDFNIIGDIEDQLSGKNINADKIHLRIQQRNGKKCITVIQGLPEDMDIKRATKIMKKRFSCGGSVLNDEDEGKISLLMGDQRQNVIDFFVEKDMFKVEDFVVHGY